MNWEKIGVYFAIVATIIIIIVYISDMKERIRALEVRQEQNERISRIEALLGK